MDHGSEAAAVRHSRALPLAWGTADDETMRRVLATASTLTDRRRPLRGDDVAKLRALGLILLSLQIGRAARNWRALPVRRVREMADASSEHGALITDDGAYLVLPPLDAPRGGSSAPAAFKPVSADIILPLSAPLRRVLIRMLPGDTMQGLCDLGSDDDREVRRLLRGGGDWRARTTKAGRSLRSAENWLRHRLRVIPGGDPALNAILDPDLRGAERTLSSYATIAGDRFWGLYRAAISPLDPTIPARAPEAARSRFYGNNRCPTDGMLRVAIAAFHARADRSPSNLRLGTASGPDQSIRRDHHLSMMMRCFIAVTFGTGQRGICRLASLNQVDPDTGFAWVIEKSNPAKGYGGARGVFHPRAVLRHLAAYEDYLDALGDKFTRTAPAAAHQLAELRASPGLTFFDIDGNGRLVRLTQSALCRAAAPLGWHYAPNAGRHWLRSMLIGRVPSDALAAQFGHHLDGFDVWREHSGLVPRKVSASLEPAIHQAMATIGLEVLPKSRRTHAAPFTDPAALAPRNNQRFRAGQILASAIWNGAMLDQAQEVSLIDGLRAAAERTVLPTWIEFDLRERLDQQRWHIDATTRRLLNNYRARGLPPIAGVPDRLLSEFLGGDALVERFRIAAATRWRFRLPPILFAHATGALVNHSLRDERFEPGGRRRIANYAERPRQDKRGTGLALAQCFRGYWREKDPLIWRRKKRTHAAMLASLNEKSFYQRMTQLERSLARGLVDGLVLDRGHSNTRGYTASTQIERVRRLWQHFVPLTPASWEENPIDRLPLDILLAALPKGVAASDVAADLVLVLRALSPNADSEGAIAALQDHAENYSVNLVHPIEYKALIDAAPTGASHWIGPALTLCYRTGLRFSELSAVETTRITRDEAGLVTVTLDHQQKRRLKTFHSRRIIPLDVLLKEKEREALQTLIQIQSARPFPSDLESNHPEVIGRLRAVVDTSTSVFPLRHAFATNALAALLWPDEGCDDLARFIDPLLLERRHALRHRLCGPQSLGAIAPHALAVMMGHTSPHRTLFSYAHHLEVMVAAHVRAAADERPALALSKSCFRRTTSLRKSQAQALIGETCHTAG